MEGNYVAEFVLVHVEVEGKDPRINAAKICVNPTLLMDFSLETPLSECAEWISEQLQLPKTGLYRKATFLLGDFGPKTCHSSIGSRCFNGSSRLADFLCHDQPIMVRFFATPNPIEVFVKTYLERTVVVSVDRCATVEQFKGAILQELENDALLMSDKQLGQFFFARFMDDKKMLSDYDVRSWSTVDLSMQLQGGRQTVGHKLVDVTRSDALYTMAFSPTAPTWRGVSPGLCLEGRCQNPSCPAYNKMVICNMGFQDVNLVTEQPKVDCCCPKCNEDLKPIKAGFNKCLWKLTAVKKSSPESVFQRPWERAANAYTTYDEALAGKFEFACLQIFVRPLSTTSGRDTATPAPFCPICFTTVDGRQTHEQQCDHVVHEECWKRWKGKLDKNGFALYCPRCG
ncbi:hypothetical protein ACA910_016464 [Epithemia clementina (nom. ined.)]